MTGFRIGYVAAHADVIAALVRLQSHSTGNVCTFAQHGALAALDMDPSIVAQRREELRKRRDLAFALVSGMFPCVKPQGAFYLFPDVSGRLKPGETSADLALDLLENAGVAVVPGEAFHGPGHVRISFGVGEDVLRAGFERMKAFFSDQACLPHKRQPRSP